MPQNSTFAFTLLLLVNFFGGDATRADAFTPGPLVVYPIGTGTGSLVNSANAGDDPFHRSVIGDWRLPPQVGGRADWHRQGFGQLRALQVRTCAAASLEGGPDHVARGYGPPTAPPYPIREQRSVQSSSGNQLSTAILDTPVTG